MEIHETKSGKKFNKGYLWIKFILVMVIALVSAFLIALSPVFNISIIEVQGGSRYNENRIIEASGILVGTNGFTYIGRSFQDIISLRYGSAEGNILESCPYIKDAEIRFLIPNRVKIKLSERVPVCMIPYLGTNLLVDESGHVLETVEKPELYEVPTVKGLKFENYETGHPLEVQNKDNFDALIELLQMLRESDTDDSYELIPLINYIDIGDITTIYMLLDSRIGVNLGETDDLKYKINAVKLIMQKNINQYESGILDFTTGQNPILKRDK